jgi:hypothetical protein
MLKSVRGRHDRRPALAPSVYRAELAARSRSAESCDDLFTRTSRRRPTLRMIREPVRETKQPGTNPQISGRAIAVAQAPTTMLAVSCCIQGALNTPRTVSLSGDPDCSNSRCLIFWISALWRSYSSLLRVPVSYFLVRSLNCCSVVAEAVLVAGPVALHPALLAMITTPKQIKHARSN